MRTVLRPLVVVVLAVHGLIHLMGVVKGFGLAEVAELTQPVGVLGAVGWLVAAVLVLLAVLGIALDRHGWWWLALVAAIASQVMVHTAWVDAWAGTLANVLLLAAAVYGWASRGPRGLRSEYAQRRAALARPRTDAQEGGQPADPVTEEDLRHLPEAVATYIRRSGAVGRPPVTGFRATIHGRIRSSSSTPWMRFTGEQVNTYGRSPTRLFLLDATMFGLPVDVLHVYDDARATMRVKLASLLPIVALAGWELDRTETVTILNDMCVLAPAALIDAPIRWEDLDARHVRATYQNGPHSVSAVLVFDEVGDLADFVCDERGRTSVDGSTLTTQRWSTPVREYRDLHGRRLATDGRGLWHAPEPEGTFAYLEFHLDDLVCESDSRSAAADQPFSTLQR